MRKFRNAKERWSVTNVRIGKEVSCYFFHEKKVRRKFKGSSDGML